MKKLILCLILISGCNPNGAENASTNTNATDANLYFTFGGEPGGGDGTHGMVPPFGTCALTAPGETVVLARAKTDFEATLYQPCEPGQPYLSGHLKADLGILRQSGPPMPAQVSASLWFVGSADLNVSDNTPAQTTVLASLRRAGDEWVAMAAVVVTATGPEPSSVTQSDVETGQERLITLPTSWSDLMTEVGDVRANYATVCDEFENYFFGARAMSDDEFDQLIHTPIPTQCEPERDTGPDPVPDAG